MATNCLNMLQSALPTLNILNKPYQPSHATSSTSKLVLPRTFQRQSMATVANTNQFHPILQSAPYTPRTLSTCFLRIDRGADVVFSSALVLVGQLNVALEAVLAANNINILDLEMKSEATCGNGGFDIAWGRRVGSVFKPIMILEYKRPHTVWLDDWLPAIITHVNTAGNLVLQSRESGMPNVERNAARHLAQLSKYAMSGCQMFLLFDGRGMVALNFATRPVPNGEPNGKRYDYIQSPAGIDFAGTIAGGQNDNYRYLAYSCLLAAVRDSFGF